MEDLERKKGANHDFAYDSCLPEVEAMGSSWYAS